jgi:hypothetical protein
MGLTVEQEYLGGQKARVWTYVILAGLLLVAVLIGSFAYENPGEAKAALDGFLGLPGWAIVAIVAVVGALVFWGGLKIEADWPEALGAAMIAGAIMAAEVMIGLDHFALFGMSFMPYFLPLFAFVILFAVGMLKSV